MIKKLKDYFLIASLYFEALLMLTGFHKIELDFDFSDLKEDDLFI